ncbi:MAG TPA: sugar ABC transporter permease [Actinospica sp.]|jgi:multiple sugar transport system permease protein|nr:sugar ABC transporter permease [Actinospica sp.]
MSPFFVLFTAVTLIPVGYAVYLSLYRTEASGLGFGGAVDVFVGLGNYTRTLGDAVFRSGFAHVAEYGIVYVPVMLIAAVAAALLLDSALAKASRFFQLVFFLPSQVPGILAAIIWLYLYTPHVSPVVQWLTDLGATPNLNHPAWSVPAMANVAVWQFTGYNIVIFYAALKAVPREVIEAAVVDGAGEWRTAVGIKLPLIGPAASLAGMMTLVGVLQLFNEPLVLGSIAPGSISAVWSPNLYLYNAAFTDNDYAAAAAGSILLALLSGVLSFVVIRLTRRWRDLA